MTTPPDDLAAVRVYTSAEAAELVRGGAESSIKVTASTFDSLARRGVVECTMIGRKRGWTLAQIAAAVAYCATSSGGEGAKASAPTRRESSRKAAASDRPHGSIAPLVAKRGSRYAASH